MPTSSTKEKRSKTITITVTPTQYAAIERCAGARTVSEYVHDLAIMTGPSAPTVGHVILAEVIMSRTVELMVLAKMAGAAIVADCVAEADTQEHRDRIVAKVKASLKGAR